MTGPGVRSPIVVDKLPAYCDPLSSMYNVACCMHHVCLSVVEATSSVACGLPIGFLFCHTELIVFCVQVGSERLHPNQSAQTRRLFSVRVPPWLNLSVQLKQDSIFLDRSEGI